MQRIQFYLPEPQIAWLEAESRRTDTSMAELVRRAIDLYRQQIGPRRLMSLKEKPRENR